MIRQAWVRVYITETKRDISYVVESLKFEHTVEKDDLTEIKIKSENAYDFADDKDMQEGTNLTYQWGWRGGASSDVHEGRMTDVEVTYGEERVSMTLKVLDGGTIMKKTEDNKIWENVTSSDVAAQLAKKYGYKAVIEKTSDVHKSLPQGNKTDFEFLKQLSTEEHMNFYVHGTTMYFQKMDLTKPSSATFVYQQGGGGNIINFSPRFRESQQDGASGGVDGKSIDPLTGKSVDNSVTPANQTNNGALGPKTYDLVANANGITQKVVKTIVQPPLIDKNDKTGEKAAQGLKEKGKKKHHESTLKTLGIPSMLSDIVITVGGVAKRHAGNWYVKKATHNIQAEGDYYLTFDLDKNAGKEGNEEATNVNDSKGPNTVNGRKDVLAATANGNARKDNTYIRLNKKGQAQ